MKSLFYSLSDIVVSAAVSFCDGGGRDYKIAEGKGFFYKIFDQGI